MLLAPKLAVGGAYSVHKPANIQMNGTRPFMGYVSALPNSTNRVDPTVTAGSSISYKTDE